MVQLTRIYTRGGDQGETSLADGARVPKYDPRVETYGTVDEANAVIGIARLHTSRDRESDDERARRPEDSPHAPSPPDASLLFTAAPSPSARLPKTNRW